MVKIVKDLGSCPKCGGDLRYGRWLAWCSKTMSCRWWRVAG